MSNDRQIAVKLTQLAALAVGTERGQQHGDTEASFQMIAELWSTWINHATTIATDIRPMPEIHLTAFDVAQMMSMVKKGRSLYGDRTMPDHYADDIGYSALAGMLASGGHPVPEALPEQLPADPWSGEGGAVGKEIVPPAEIPSFLKSPKKDNTNAA